MFIAEETNDMLKASPDKDHVVLLAVRLVCLSVMVALLTMHIRSVRVFRWEQSVSGGLLVTYIVAVVGLALCAGIEECGAKVLQQGIRSIYGMRLLAFSTVVILMTAYLRPRRVFRWDLSYSGIQFTVHFTGVIGLYICVGMGYCGFDDLKAYLCGVGGVLLAVNAISIWRRWRYASNITRVVAELLGALGVPLRRQVLIKVSLSAVAAALMLTDFTWTLIQSQTVKSRT